MSVEQYLIYRLRLRGERAMRQRRRLKWVMENCELEEVADQRIGLLSHGFKKRIGLADAMMQHPRLLLLDDPLTGLDVGRRKKIGAALTDFSAHAAVVLAGHEIDEMLQWCTRFIVLSEGKISASYRTTEYERDELSCLLRGAVSGSGEGV